MGLFLLAVFAGTTTVQAQEWVQLGCRDVDLNVDRDVIRVGTRDGFFRAVRLRAVGNDVEMLNLRVIYGNGAPDDIPVRARIPENGASGALDLRGDNRYIDRIELLYTRVPNWRGRAHLCVDGLAAPTVRAWVPLGCRDVDLRGDRDVIRVGTQYGLFRAIRLIARGNSVQMHDLKVFYGNGAADDIAVRARIPENGTSGPLDLRGNDRYIDRIEMIYARDPNFRGRAQICVDGLKA